jgi:hypothetical protein
MVAVDLLKTLDGLKSAKYKLGIRDWAHVKGIRLVPHSGSPKHAESVGLRL